MDSFLHAEDLNSMARGESGIESGKSRAGLLTGWVALGKLLCLLVRQCPVHKRGMTSTQWLCGLNE